MQLSTVQSWSESPGLQPTPKTQGTTLADLFRQLKLAVVGCGQRDLAAQQRQAPTRNRNAAGMLADMHFTRGGLRWRVIM